MMVSISVNFFWLSSFWVAKLARWSSKSVTSKYSLNVLFQLCYGKLRGLRTYDFIEATYYLFVLLSDLLAFFDLVDSQIDSRVYFIFKIRKMRERSVFVKVLPNSEFIVFKISLIDLGSEKRRHCFKPDYVIFDLLFLLMWVNLEFLDGGAQVVHAWYEIFWLCVLWDLLVNVRDWILESFGHLHTTVNKTKLNLLTISSVSFWRVSMAFWRASTLKLSWFISGILAYSVILSERILKSKRGVYSWNVFWIFIITSFSAFLFTIS